MSCTPGKMPVTDSPDCADSTSGAEISSSYPGSKMDTAFLDLLPRRDAGHLLRLLKGFSPKPLAGVRWVTSAGSLHIGGTWSDLPSGGDVIVIDKRSLSAAQPLA